ncbi:adenosinetriphosphatase [Plasmodium inui San Antonio 1]|uniref:Adenosinetriphosphatase n=1 Tax=Plasmodium inui San Antonio 1 TaxID=1237626 RepID=W7AL91_9APIC|nr:adenosinetriphosphatase [Plasmodium inui San Antonio 1]EUD69534.1 adenosinetriphosphatase [Plasmodium inui San Antonio 1]
MKPRLNNRLKGNSYYEYSIKHGTYDIDEAVAYIERSSFSRSCGGVGRAGSRNRSGGDSSLGSHSYGSSDSSLDSNLDRSLDSNSYGSLDSGLHSSLHSSLDGSRNSSHRRSWSRCVHRRGRWGNTLQRKLLRLMREEKKHMRNGTHKQREPSKAKRRSKDHEEDHLEGGESGLMYVHDTCEQILNSGKAFSQGTDRYIILNRRNQIKKISLNEMNELLTEIIYTTMTRDNLENSLLDLLGEEHIDFIFNIIKNKENIKRDIKLLSKYVDVKEKILASNFFITDKTMDGINSRKNIFIKKENIEKIVDFFLYTLRENNFGDVKKIYIPNEENKLEEIQVPRNTSYSYTDNVTKVRINRLENFQFSKDELVPVKVLPFWHRYIFEFEHFNYVQSKVFKAAFQTNKNLLVSAPTGCGKTNIALLVILQQISLFCEQNGISLERVAQAYLVRCGDDGSTQEINHANIHKAQRNGQVIHHPLKGEFPSEDRLKGDPLNGDPTNEDAPNEDAPNEDPTNEDLPIGDLPTGDPLNEDPPSDEGASDEAPSRGGNSISAKEFKIIYIAPMKSLVFEITNLFQRKLKIFNLKVCEYTKEHSLTSKQLEEVHIIVTVPEKLDILLRNSSYSTTVSDESLIKHIKCLILDEVHLLNTDRGDVIETIVARFLRYSETSQSVRRIMAMSATLPNYNDVRDFLKVEKDMCFYFNESYRSIQLDKTLYGIHEKNMNKLNTAKNIYAYGEIINALRKDKQCIIFVCSRNDTNKTIQFLIDYAVKNGEIDYFVTNLYTDSNINKRIKKSNNMYVKQFYEFGCSVHHAGMSRSDKILVEDLFKKKAFNVLCCTSTLAWGVNLPVHTVIIKGTNFFSSESGKMEDMDILDINQIFGRCGRPQYEDHGHAILITERTKLYKYIKLLTNNTIIESSFLKNIENHLNAEISIGTTKNVEDGIKWLEYTYLYVRMKKTPNLYDADLTTDIHLYNKRKEIILKTIQNLSENKLVRRVLLTNDFIGTFYGHIAAKYYVDYQTIGIFAANIDRSNYVEVIDVISKSKEFENIQIRNEDMNDFLWLKSRCEIKEQYDESKSMTLRILIESYLRRIQINNFSLICEINYVIQNIIRILYAYYEICLNILKNISNLIMNTHNLIVSILRRLPINSCVFRHFCYRNELLEKKNMTFSSLPAKGGKNRNAPPEDNAASHTNHLLYRGKYVNPREISEEQEYGHNHDFHDTPQGRYRKNQNYTVYLKESVVNILEKKKLTHESVDTLTKSELLFFLRNEVYTNQILYYKNVIPNLHIEGYIQPITQTIMKINLQVQLTNTIWSDQWNDIQENFHLFLLNTLNNDILYFQKFSIHKKDRKKIHDISFEFPLSNQMPPQITVQFLSMNWCNLSYVHIFNTNNLFINQKINIFSEILPVIPLSTQILKIASYIKFFPFRYFNPIQTQMFHATFHTDENILLGAPTGSGKTVIGELCILRNLLHHERQKAVYVCPMKAIVNERHKSWTSKFKSLLNKNVIELTGDKNENKENIAESDIIICTPEKLDVISRNWKNKKFVQNVNLIIFDEIHLLGQENRGGVIEILINRFKNMEQYLNRKIRLVGLTTVITSVDDLILWLDVKENYLFNFPSSCRIVPCKTHILGFTQKAYCARMSVMNKNVFDAINQYAQSKNVLIFVSSRRQTRVTGYDIISLNLSSHNLNFLHTENLLNDKSHIQFLLNSRHDDDSHLDNDSGDDEPNDLPDYTALMNKNLSVEEKTQVANMLFQNYLNIIENEHLKDLLKYGIGIHHAGLNENDKNIVEYFFLNKIIQILICTSTLAWGINLPAYLVIIKGNEFYDAKTKKYKDISYTDLLQMIGRAGRPQFDDKALAILLVQERRKNAIKNFLYHPMNIESNILENLNEHINAEICSKVINNREDIFNYLTKSYYFKRLFSNPSYYIKDVQYVQLFDNNTLSNQAKKVIYEHVNKIIDSTISFLQINKCIQVTMEDYMHTYCATPLGHIASVYYLKCETVSFFYKMIEQSCGRPNGVEGENDKTEEHSGHLENGNHVVDHGEAAMDLGEDTYGEAINDQISGEINEEISGSPNEDHCVEEKSTTPDHRDDGNNHGQSRRRHHRRHLAQAKELNFYGLFALIAQAREFDDVPLRHNEDKYNVKLRNQIPLDIDMNMKNVKTYLLLLSRLYECTYETVDYNIDLKLVMDQIARVINGFIDICLLFGKYNYIQNLILIYQCINQKIQPSQNSLHLIKNIKDSQLAKLAELQIKNLKDLLKFDKSFLYSLNIFHTSQLDFIFQIPSLTSSIKLFRKSINLSNDFPQKKYNIVSIPCVSHLKNENKFFFQMKHHDPNEIVIRVFFCFFHKASQDAISGATPSANVQWYAILHDCDQDESISIKRFNNSALKKTSSVSFTLEDLVQGTYHFAVYAHSDTFYGIDHEVHFQLSVE